MRDKLNLNDLHIGATRVAGTTPQTAMDLRLSLLGKVRDLLMAHTDKDVLINGDLFDKYNVAMGDALAMYEICCDWLEDSYIGALGSDQPELVIGRGNHDASKDSSQLSMFDFFGAILKARYPERVRIITEPTLLWPGFYMIPHAVNQDIFNAQLAEAAKLPAPCYVFLHANYDNGFAVEEDHSLNVSRAQADTLTDKGLHLIFGHVHQQHEARGVTVVGNQFPTSVSDCLDNDTKRCIVFKPHDLSREDIQTWEIPGSFLRIDWRDVITLDAATMPAEFIRVEGEATAEEAADVVATVSALRKASQAFVVTNSVRIAGVDSIEDIQLVAEEMRGVDVLNYLMEQLDPEQGAVVKRLLQEAA